ncbi:uncharacterized protein LOC144637947 [Oculina patagonica]
MLHMVNGCKLRQAFSIGLVVACFLLNTSRVLKAIELCKECLFILKNKAVIIDEKWAESFYKVIYLEIANAYGLIGDNTNAINYARKVLHIHRDCGEKHEECQLSIQLAIMYIVQYKYVEANELSEKALAISKEIGDRNKEAYCYLNLGTVCQSVGEYKKAREYYEKALAIEKENGDRNGEAKSYLNLGTVYQAVGEYERARNLLGGALTIAKEIGDRNSEALCYGNLGTVFLSLNDYAQAKEYLEKALSINEEIARKEGKAFVYGNLGIVFKLSGEYEKATKFFEEAIAVNREIGDRNGEAYCYRNFGTMHHLVGEYEKAKEHLEKSLAINKETGDRNGEASCYGNLGIFYESVGQYEKAREYHEKALAITKEIGVRNLEASCYRNLGTVYRLVGEYKKSREYHLEALAISKESSDRHGEAYCYGSLGVVFQAVHEYESAKEYLEKALLINKEIGDRDFEASCYHNLGIVYELVGEYEKARQYYEKALVTQKEVFGKKREAPSWGNLGNVYEFVGDYEKARKCYGKALAISKETGDINSEADSYENLGTLFHTLGKYANTNEYHQKALAIRKQIGDRRGEASSYGNLGELFRCLGDFDTAKDYHEKALAIRKDIGDRKGEALDYQNLGTMFKYLGECDKAEEYFRKGLSISEEIGDVRKQLSLLCQLAFVNLMQEKIQETLLYLMSAVQKCENLRSFLQSNDQFQISFTDKNVSPYWLLSALLCDAGYPKDALRVSELGRARALADLMSAQYSVENQISAKPETWISTERIIDKECNSTCLYVSYSCENIYLWILNGSGVVHLRRKECQGNEMNFESGAVRNVDDFFVNEIFRRFRVLPEKNCEDRSLQGFQREPKSCEENSLEASRIGKDDKDNLGPKVNLSLCYKLIITPVTDLLDGSEIIIVPDRSLYNIPFAALPDENGNYLSESFRIRVVPSLTTLKLIHDSPADYHSQTGALIVGNPDVGEVHLHGRLTDISRLPCAENEAKMIAGKLGVKPLLGQEATKQAVLEVINSVSLIHLAAHGDAERGEIALAPALRIPNMIPQEEHYLLTMSDISKVQLRAKLVVLSCCHSGRGQIRAEGVVGIARAFLGSGARSVLVALWALEDSATEEFMSRFYVHLVGGESASESLHKAMKWMRCNGYSDVRQWAPFILIGDNVTFDFEKQGAFCKIERSDHQVEK